ncbi:MAG: NFACT RNA binding domain-containing protein [archaeon]|nr:NFACT RNA binding domain-containing protein [archaeon]
MKITLRFDRTVQENAATYFEKAKKAKKKLGGLKTAIRKMGERIGFAHAEETLPRAKTIEKKKEKKWFEKFRWFYSSNGFLVLAGRDAKSNEQLLKKHFEKGDVFFHADIAGSAHVIVKTGGKKIPEQTAREAAQFAAAMCKAWQEKLAGTDVYSAEYEQVTKEAPSGESIGTGAFMVYGKREWFRKTALEFAVGMDEGSNLVSGPKSAVKKNSKNFFIVHTGTERKTDAAKKIKKFFEKNGARVSLDEIVQALPSGEVSVELAK